MTDIPLVSVVMPVYNREDYLEQAIQSVLQQSYPNVELIIVDDASTDRSNEIASKFANENASVWLFRNDWNNGINFSRNRGISVSLGEFIAFLDSDDIADPERFSKQVALLQSGFDMVGSAISFMDAHGYFLGVESVACSQKEIESRMRFTLPLPNPSLMARRSVFEKVGAYRFPYAEDYDFFLRAYDLGFSVTNHPDVLVKMRMHFQNTGVLHVRQQRFLTRLAFDLHRERVAHGKELTNWQRELENFSPKECFLEHYGAHFYRKAYVLRRSRPVACLAYLALACMVWPPNVPHLLRRFS